MNEHRRAIFNWLPTLDDAALQRIHEAPAEKWDNFPTNAGSPVGGGCLLCIASGNRYRSMGDHHSWAAESAYMSMRRESGIRDGAWGKTTPREITDPIRAEARRILAERRLARMNDVTAAPDGRAQADGAGFTAPASLTVASP